MATRLTTVRSSTAPQRLRNVHLIQNFHLVWLDENIDENKNEDCRNSIIRLRQVVNTVNTFTDANECINFINSIKEEKTFMISSGALGQTTVPIVHDKPQMSTIYVFCGNKARHEKWTKNWPKVAGVYTDIQPICEALKQAVQDCDHNSVSISFVKTTDGVSDQNLDQLGQSFMYTQILKEILLTIDFEQKHIDEFLTYCREQLADNNIELNNVEKLRKEYHLHEPIWWYTYECFLYSMLNRALRLMQVDLIIKMGFFIRDLHNHIAELHSEQYNGENPSDSFIVYRGQGLSQTDFERLQATQGGLLSFNNFLSTSQNLDVSLDFARRTMATSDSVGVLFILHINPSIDATPFAKVENIGYFSEEKEILFSMHSVFRIRRMKKIDENDCLWQVELTLTSEKDPQLNVLTEHMRKETSSSDQGWHRLGKLMITLGEFNKAEELYNILLEQTSNERDKGFLFYQLGWIKDNQGNNAEAIEFYEKSLEINKETLPENHSDLATSYNNLGLVYDNMGKHSQALSYYKKALEIYQKSLPINHRNFAAAYNNIGSVYDIMGEYPQALSYYEKAFEIFQKNLPANHPDFADSYNNIGLVYTNMGEYSKALSYYSKALEIKQKTLPENHLSLATSYNNIAGLYYSMNEYSKARSYFERALEIFEKTSTNHPNLASSYNNIGHVCCHMGEYSKALSYFERALDIKQRSLPSNHPSIEEMKEKIENVKKRL